MTELVVPLLGWFVLSMVLSVAWLIGESRVLARSAPVVTAGGLIPAPRSAARNERVEERVLS